MKILYVGSLSPTACSTFYLKALKDLGHTVTAYDPKAFETAGALESFTVRLTKNPSPRKTTQISTELLELAKETAFDAILVIAENFIPDILEEIRALRKPAPVFIYHSHDNNFAKGILKPDHFFGTLAKYDFLYTTKSQNVARYKALGNENSFFIPSAFEPQFHHPVDASHSKFTAPLNISFVGTYDYSRDRFFEQLEWEDLYIWGNEWKRYQGFKKHRDHITPRAIYLEEYADVISHSKVSLGLLREEAEDLHTQRTFEIPACGSLQMAPRNEEILTFFEEGKEIICFDSPEELKEKAKYYLTHDRERAQIAQKGYERCMADHHTYLDRVKAILKPLNSR